MRKTIEMSFPAVVTNITSCYISHFPNICPLPGIFAGSWTYSNVVSCIFVQSNIEPQFDNVTFPGQFVQL